MISIHALLAESDNSLLTSVVSSADFYPRSPCGERPTKDDQATNTQQISIHALLAESDLILHMARLTEHLFLSTLSLRRATFIMTITIYIALKFLSTLSLRRATKIAVHSDLHSHISIHALLAESDARRESRQQPAGISIHALLAESDGDKRRKSSNDSDFYPRSPCGERQYAHKGV